MASCNPCTPSMTGCESMMMPGMMMSKMMNSMPYESCFNNTMPSTMMPEMPMSMPMPMPMMNRPWMMPSMFESNWSMMMPWMNSRGMMTPFEWCSPMMMNNCWPMMPWSMPMNNWMMPSWCNTESRTNNTNMSCVGFRPSSEIEFYCLTNPIRVLDREGNRMIWLCFDMRGYKPEEVCCTFNKAERCITVEATHDVKEGKDHHITRKFFRKFCFPESLAKCDMSKCELKSCLNSNGMLTVECTLPKMTCEELAACPPSMMMSMMSPMNSADCYFANNYGRPSYRTNTNVSCKITA